MPTPTTYYAQAQRFVRQFRDPVLTATYASLTTAVSAYSSLQSRFWKHLPVYLSPSFPPHEETENNPSNVDYFDAYLICAEHADGLHRAYAGMTAYRIELPAAFVGQTLTSLAVDVACDPFTPDGARVALATSAAATLPSDTWLTCREGSAYADGVAPRTSATVGDKLYWYAATDEALLAPAGGLVLGKYLWVYLSLERYDRARNGWLEGSAVIRPTFTLLMADAVGGVTGGSNIGGGYTAPTITLATADVSAGPVKTGSATVSTGAQKELASQEIFTAYRKASFTTFATAAKLAPCLRQLITGAPGNPCPLLTPGTAEGQLRSLFLATSAGGWNAPQVGLNANLKAYTSTYDYIIATASYYLLPYTPVPNLTPSVMTLTNGSSAISLEGATVQLTPWFIEAPCQLTAAVANLQWIMMSLARQRSFWTGDNTGLTGDTVNNGDGGATDYTVNATRIGDPTQIPDSLAASASFGITLYNVPSKPGFIVLVPWMPNPSTALAPTNGAVAGLGATYGFQHDSYYGTGHGWYPGIILS